MTISANFPTINPSLNLDFANSKTLDPRITFSRPTTGTYYNSYSSAVAEQNLLLWSQDVTNATWTKSAVTATISGTAPDGTATANLIVPTTASAIHRVNNLSGSTVSGTQYVYSVFAKASGYEFLYINGIYTAGQVCFNLTTGAVAATSAGTGSITSVGNGWYRCVVTATANGTASGSATLQVNNSGVATDTTFAGDGTSGIYVWGAQLEQRSSATAYTATTTTSITNYIPVLQTAVANEARFDHNPTTRESLGLLIEEQRTNLVTYSDDFANAAWSKDAATISSNVIFAPDGTLTGDKVVANTTTTAHGIRTNPTVADNTTYAWSFYAKAGEYTWVSVLTVNKANTSGISYVNLSTGATGTIAAAHTISVTSVGNGWYRIACAFGSGSGATSLNVRAELSTANDGRILAGNDWNGLYLWGAQLEAGAFATSYIPTVASQVTRSADSASMTGANFSSWYNQSQGSYFVQGVPRQFSNQPIFLADSTGVFSMYIGANAIPAAYQGSALSSGITVANFTPFKMSYSFNSTGNSVSANGASVASSTGNKVPSVTTIQLGQSSGSYFINGYIQKIQYYPIALTSVQLQALTGS
jgi:hypothetical protein